MLFEQANAKINLTLEILGKRDDGYHELRSLVAFADFGDELSFAHANEFSLEIEGPFAADLEGENLIEKAVNFVRLKGINIPGGCFHLMKKLPVASGIGGGSADAAAALRLVLRSFNVEASTLNFSEIASALGADIPVCMDQNPVFMTGIGEHLSPVAVFPKLPAVLINPGVPVSTGMIFKTLNAAPLSAGFKTVQCPGQKFSSLRDVVQYMSEHENDLQPIAMELEPAIAAILSLLEKQEGIHISRMSGSGATCFGIFENMDQANTAASNIADARSGWWVQSCVIS